MPEGSEAQRRKQDDYFRSNISNLMNQVLQRDAPRFSRFLDERERGLAQGILNSERCRSYLFFGGAEDCERVMLGIFPEGLAAEPSAFPIAALHFSVRGVRPAENSTKEEPLLSHRDYLGALMALQIERDRIGDIAVKGNAADIFMSNAVSDFVLQNLTQVGRYPIDSGEAALGEIELHREFEEITGTVPSLRLDCVVSMVLGKSRRVAEETIDARLVRLNGLEASNGAKQLSAGDVLSIRGKGKYILGEEAKKTKKDRIFISVNKLI